MNPHVLWSPSDGRELDATPINEVRPTRIVACLNVWNDVNALRQTMPTWIRAVDHVIAVDGMYGEKGELSTDGTRDFLQCLPSNKITLIDSAGGTQCAKRTQYLRAAQQGDLLFIIDADESVINADALHDTPLCDVGWVRIQSPMYSRTYGQPRLFAWRPNLQYERRHHWIFCDGRLLATHQYGGTGFNHVTVPIVLHNQRRLGRSRERLVVKGDLQTTQVADERVELSNPPFSTMSDTKIGGREALQIVHCAYRDDGLAPSRLHTAINRTTPHSSLFFKSRPGPFDVPSQYMAREHAARYAAALTTADVIHYHGVMSNARPSRTAWIVFHHHGTLFRNNADAYMQDAKKLNALVLLSNLELLSWIGDGTAHFLPNPVPVARYLALREKTQIPFDGSSLFRVAHSPSQPQRKGTAEFLQACDRLQKRGVPIQPVVIHDQSHRNALAIKATCHAAFDSFWLGMQCSGVEAAAMGLPVIAGDPIVSKRYISEFGDIPYTYANDVDLLEHELFTLINDATYRANETTRVFEHVRQFHDESAVALRYLDLLDGKFGWRSRPVRPPSPAVQRVRSRR